MRRLVVTSGVHNGLAGRPAPVFLEPAASEVILALETRATADGELISRVSETLGRWDDAATSTALAAMTTVAEDALLPISREVGQLIFTLVLASKAQRVVEYGTSLGVSTIYLAGAARLTGGRVIGTEISDGKRAEAVRNLRAAELESHVEILLGDARETLRSVAGPIDVLLLDGWVPLYLEIFQLLEPRLARGSIVVCDTVRVHREKLAAFYGYVDGLHDRYIRTPLPLDDGVDVIVRC